MIQRRITDPYSVHRMVYSCFPRDAGAGRILYADQGSSRDGRKVLILSSCVPEIDDTIPSTTTEITENFFAFSAYRFEVSLNPVKCDAKTHRRMPVTGQLQLLQWFIARSAQWGFEPDTQTLEALPRPVVRFDRDPAECIFNHAFFRGSLRVTDRQLFQNSALSGLGHGKAFGFGLLRLRPLPTTMNSNHK
jgi:CRISPR system Cascade subunit CasE